MNGTRLEVGELARWIGTGDVIRIEGRSTPGPYGCIYNGRIVAGAHKGYAAISVIEEHLEAAPDAIEGAGEE